MLFVLVRHLTNVGPKSPRNLDNTVIVESSYAPELKGDSKHSHINILKRIYPSLNAKVYSSSINDEESLYLNRYSISLNSLGYLVSLLAHLIMTIGTKQFFVLQSYWLSYSKHIALFESYSPSILVYLTFPNGRGSYRSDDAVVTGLARVLNIQCHGIQTRSIYINKYEDCFDVFDKYYSWKDYWNNVEESRFIKVKKLEFIDCIYTYENTLDKAEENTILIFDGDINNNSHYNENYYAEFISALSFTASRMKSTKFIFKFKNEKCIQYNESLIRLFENCNNVKRLSNSRFDYEEVLANASMVVSIGFTTPGYEAVLAGKSSVYYSSWPKEYLNFNDKIMIASTQEELFKVLSQSTEIGNLSASK